MSWSARLRNEETLPRLHGLGVRMVGLTVGSDRTPGPAAALAEIDAIDALVQGDGRYLLAGTAQDIQRAIAEGKLALELNFQGIGPLGGDLGQIAAFAERGLRHMGLCWNWANEAGGSATENHDDGLTRFGREAIREMERVGVLVDGAHAGQRTMMESIDASRRPFIVSHTNCFSVTRARCNVSDEQIRACAATGGVLGMTGFGNDIGDPMAGSEALFRHIDHVAQLVGVAHVALGLDFVAQPQVFWDMVQASPQTWPDMEGKPQPRCRFHAHEQLGELVPIMRRAGYTDEHMAAVMGGNWLRLFREVWK